ncbi:hypothetical protein GOODEAATRI_031067, partial [Goodea atripinnis]
LPAAEHSATRHPSLAEFTGLHIQNTFAAPSWVQTQTRISIIFTIIYSPGSIIIIFSQELFNMSPERRSHYGS